jgi:FAD:protein FMN transferase
MNRPEDHRRPSRREFLALGMGAFVVAAMPGVVRPRRQLVRRAVPVMGTIAEVGVVHRDARYAQGAIDAAIAELRSVERTMTRFRDDSDIGRANLGAARGPVAVGAATAQVLAAGLVWAERSDGSFDPAIGRTVGLWDVGHSHAPPARQEVSRLAGRGLYRSLEIARWRGEDVVAFADPEIALDLGGIAKGYGVDRAVAALREWGVTDALVNVGGDLYAMGRSAAGEEWEVGVRDPDDPRAIAARFTISDRAVATSGDYQQYFEHGGARYHHLLDPGTGAPRQTRVRSVTIAADHCMSADAAATAAFGQDRTSAQRLIARVDAGATVMHIG